MDPICDITEVTAQGACLAYSLIGQFVDIQGAAGCTLHTGVVSMLSCAGAGAITVSEIQITRTTVSALGADSYTDHLDAMNLVTVRGRGNASILSLVRDLAEVTAEGDVVALQSRIVQRVAVTAAGVAQAIQAGRFGRLTDIAGTAAVAITNQNAVRQVVTVAATAAVTALQSGVLRNMVTVTAEGLAEIASQSRSTRDLTTVTASGAASITIQHVTARTETTVEGCADAEIVTDGDPGLAWTAATESLGMSRYVLPFRLSALAPFGDLVMVAGPDGLHLMDGATDGVGRPTIDAKATGPLVDTGESFLKHPVSLYVAYVSASPVAIHVGETSNGTERTWDYSSAAIVNVAPRPIRIMVGKGIRSRYLRFAISNTVGAALSVRDAEYDTIQTTRRT